MLAPSWTRIWVILTSGDMVFGFVKDFYNPTMTYGTATDKPLQRSARSRTPR